MGFSDIFGKKVNGNKPTAVDPVKGPSRILWEQGIDPSNLKFSFQQGGFVTVSGMVASQSESDLICQIISKTPYIKKVKNELIVIVKE